MPFFELILPHLFFRLSKSLLATFDCSTQAEISRIGGPLTIAGSDQIGDDTADISLLGGVIIGSSVVPGDRHRPCLVTVVKPFQELRGIGDVLCGVEHFGNRGKFTPVKMDVDLHAADIDQLRTAASGILHQLVSVRHGGRKIGLAFNVDGIGAERPLAACLRQTDRIEDAFRYPIMACGGLYLAFAIRSRGCLGGLTDRRGQDECRRREQQFQAAKCSH